MLVLFFLVDVDDTTLVQESFTAATVSFDGVTHILQLMLLQMLLMLLLLLTLLLLLLTLLLLMQLLLIL